MGHARGDTPHACLRAMLRVFLIMLVLACLLTHAHGMPSGGPIVTENVVIVGATAAANAVAANQASRVETTIGAAVDMGATVTMAESSAQGRARLNEEQEAGVRKLSAKSRADLQKMCRDRNLSTNGNNKGALATRIFIYEDYVKGGMEPAAAVERLKKRKQPSQRKQGELNAEAANQQDVPRDDDGNLVTLLTDEDLADIQAIDWSSRSQSTINEYGFALNRFKAWLLQPEQVAKGLHGLLSNKDINGNIVEDPVKNWRQRALEHFQRPMLREHPEHPLVRLRMAIALVVVVVPKILGPNPKQRNFLDPQMHAWAPEGHVHAGWALAGFVAHNVLFNALGLVSRYAFVERTCKPCRAASPFSFCCPSQCSIVVHDHIVRDGGLFMPVAMVLGKASVQLDHVQLLTS